MPLGGKVALVAGATRGAGRGIAVGLGGAGATVYCSGRPTRERRSEYDRPETIEETAEQVTEAGGTGIAAAADHLDPGQVGGLLVEVTDGTADYNASNYRLSVFYDLAKSGVIRIAWSQAQELGPRGATAVALTPVDAVGDDARPLRRDRGALACRPRAPAALRHLGDPLFTGRAVAALAADPDRARWNGASLSSGGLAQVYGFTDVDGSRPDAWRYMVEVMDVGGSADATGYR